MTKVALARLASRSLVTMRRISGVGTSTIVRRRGVRWHLDLTEGIDLSIYLLGGFERSVARACERYVGPGSVVLDLGANVGAHTLPLARCVGPTGTVVAIEATAFAHRRLRRNLALNRDLEGRVMPIHAFLVAAHRQRGADRAFASWPLGRKGPRDNGHGGVAMPTRGARVTTLDAVLQELAIGTVDFVKIDTDGNEVEVLSGGREALRRSRPTLLLEMAPYAFAGSESTFEQMIELLRALGYRFFELDGVTELPACSRELSSLIPHGAAINALAFADRRRDRPAVG